MYETQEEAFKQMAGEATLVPVSRQLVADMETPVSAFYRLAAAQPYSYLLESVDDTSHSGRYSFIGLDPFLVLRATDDGLRVSGLGQEETVAGNPWDAIRSVLDRYQLPQDVAPELPPLYAGLTGYLGYDMARHIEQLPQVPQDTLGMPLAVLVASRLVVAFDHHRRVLTLTCNVPVEQDTDLQAAYRTAVQRLDRLEDSLGKPARADRRLILGDGEETSLAVESSLGDGPFQEQVLKAKEAIDKGEAFQIVLSQRLSAPFNGDPFRLYRALRAVNPSPYMFYLNFPEGALVGASPEMLVRVQDGQVQTRPLAGTRPRGRSAGEDQRLAAELQSDEKERAEHLMLVDLGRNDIGRVAQAGSVDVTQLMEVEYYSHVMHLVSTVEGELTGERDALDALAACFPAGTLSGAPKVRAMELIDELECVQRGPYGGAVGYLSFNGDIDTCIAIRFFVVKDGQAHIQAGAGIVHDSDPQREYEETMAKAGAMLQVIRSLAGPTAGEEVAQ